MAIAGFVLALLWLCTIGSVLGIIFGFVALAQIKNSPQGGRGLAIAGIVLGFVGIAATAVIAIIAVNTADDVLEEDPLERNDVTLVSCRPGPGGDGEAQLEVTNDSSKRSSYLITISFTDTDGRTYIGTDTISGVAAGQAVTASVGAGRTLGDGYRCALNYVNRFAIAGDS